MPPWGRPSGAKGSSRRRQWEREQAFWQEARVEEPDTDDTDTQVVGLDFRKKRFASDPLRFTGIDLKAKPRARRAYAYESETSESSEDSGDESSVRQVALREKEEAIVQSALARIRRAQEKGKREVKLDPAELAALENRRKRMQSAATSTGKGSGSSSGSEKKRRKERQLVTLPLEPITNKKKTRKSDPVPSAPGLLMSGPDGTTTHAPFGYYPPPAGARTSASRPRSSTSRDLHDTLPELPYPANTHRHVSDSTRPTSSSSTSSRRPLPDEEGWIPAHSRRSSISSAYGPPMDPFEYQTSTGLPVLPHYMQPGSGHRVVSGPPEVAYSSVRRSPPANYPQASAPAAARAAALPSSYSDPALRRRSSRTKKEEVSYSEETSIESSEDESESDDTKNGVKIYVEGVKGKEKASASVPSRKPVGGGGRGSGKKRGKGK